MHRKRGAGAEPGRGGHAGLSGLADIAEGDVDALLALNNAHAAELSLLERDGFVRLLGQAVHARHVGREAFLLAFDEGAAYGSPNYLWVRARYERFVYVDRLVVAPQARGRGLARAMYADLLARVPGSLVACEVNLEPPNPASDRLHAGLGFREVGAEWIHGGAKRVRYLLRPADGRLMGGEGGG